VPEPRVGVEPRDQPGDPAVRQARHQRYAAIRRRVGDVGRDGISFVHGFTSNQGSVIRDQ